MEGTLEASETSTIPPRGKLVLRKKVEMHFWKARSGVFRSYYLKGRSQGGPKEDSSN